MKGFTLLELMMVVAIVAILGALALPAVTYQNATAQLRESLTELHGIERDMGTMMGPCAGVTSDLSHLPAYDYNLNTNTMCTVTARMYIQGAAGGQYLSAVNLNGMTLTATIGSNANTLIRNGTLTVTAVPVGNGMQWQCSLSGTSHPFTIVTCP